MGEVLRDPEVATSRMRTARAAALWPGNTRRTAARPSRLLGSVQLDTSPTGPVWQIRSDPGVRPATVGAVVDRGQDVRAAPVSVTVSTKWTGPADQGQRGAPLTDVATRQRAYGAAATSWPTTPSRRHGSGHQRAGRVAGANVWSRSERHSWARDPPVSGDASREVDGNEALAQWPPADQRSAPLSRGVWRARHVDVVSVAAAFMATDSMSSWMSAFAGTRAVIVFDQQGHGRTPDASRTMSYKQFADDAVALLRALDVERADVMGYSQGGAVGLQLALRHPTLCQQAGPGVGQLSQGRLVPVGVGGHRGSQRQSVCRYGLEKRSSSTPPTTPGRSTPTSIR